jgi:diaminopimelate epimerase
MEKFYKYQGTGNDFILIDQYNKVPIDYTVDEIKNICDRRFGIGADGFMILRKHKDYDFEMIYANSDGKPSSMCGNGGRCIVQFAYDLGYISKSTNFLAIDGAHRAEILPEAVSLEMIDLQDIKVIDQTTFELNTGSPHYVKITDQMSDLDKIYDFGRSIRYNEQYRSAGINVNLVKIEGPNTIKIATYERGVEDETYSCGTGVTAAALVLSYLNPELSGVEVHTKGGDLRVNFENIGGRFTKIKLIGPAKFVFSGEINI